MTSGNSLVWEGDGQELNLYFLLVKRRVHICLWEWLRNMGATSSVQLTVKIVQSKQKHTLTRLIPLSSQWRFPTQIVRKVCALYNRWKSLSARCLSSEGQRVQGSCSPNSHACLSLCLLTAVGEFECYKNKGYILKPWEILYLLCTRALLWQNT